MKRARHGRPERNQPLTSKLVPLISSPTIRRPREARVGITIDPNAKMAVGGQKQVTADIKKGEEDLRCMIVYDRAGLAQKATASKQRNRSIDDATPKK